MNALVRDRDCISNPVSTSCEVSGLTGGALPRDLGSGVTAREGKSKLACGEFRWAEYGELKCEDSTASRSSSASYRNMHGRELAKMQFFFPNHMRVCDNSTEQAPHHSCKLNIETRIARRISTGEYGEINLGLDPCAF